MSNRLGIGADNQFVWPQTDQKLIVMIYDLDDVIIMKIVKS